MLRAFSRLRFILRYKTFKRMALADEAGSSVAIYHRGKVVKIGRRCPHQGAPLETGYLEGNFLVCSWHGCRFSLDNGKAQCLGQS